MGVLFLLGLLLCKKPREEIQVVIVVQLSQKKKQKQKQKTKAKKKTSNAVFIFAESNFQGSDYLRELSLSCHISSFKVLSVSFLVEGITPSPLITVTSLVSFQSGICSWGISSYGRAPASHAGSTGIDARILQDRDFLQIIITFYSFLSFL